ncbi:MAG: radical SAM protein [Fimbriimonadaceae bacterium]|nr:radical SAM protein [Fimbriimonadaceae bacterium]
MRAGLPRDYRIENFTRTVCPACFAAGPPPAADAVWCDGLLARRDGAIWLRRWCPVHGESESLYEEDATLWEARQGWRTPTLSFTPDRPTNTAPFPAGYAAGLPVSHGQHTCTLVLNITQRCNLACPTCYATALPPGSAVPADERPTRAEILRTVQATIQREGGRLGVVMLSGGEPTVRGDLPDILRALCDLPVTRVMLNTNGRRIARDDALLDVLRRHRERVEVYLQYDGAGAAALRGEELQAEKLRAVQRLDEAGVFVTLVASLAKGINDQQVGAILRLALGTPHVAGVAYQPVFGSGRQAGFDPRDRLTPTGVLRRIEEQTSGQVRADDFLALPCSHPDCCDLSYLVRLADDTWKSLPALVGRDELRRWLHLIGNTITFDQLREPVVELVRSGALQRVFSEQLRSSTPELCRDVAQLCDCVPGLVNRLGGLWARVRGAGELERLAERTVRVTVKMFMDAHTFHEHRLRQCCVHSGTFEDDPRRFSFCWRWLFADGTDGLP